MTWRHKRSALAAGNIALFFVMAGLTAAQEPVVYFSRQENVTFRPPPGWSTDIMVQYAGPERSDGTRPTLNLTTEETHIDLSERRLSELTQEILQEFGEARLVGSRRTAIGVREAFQIEVAFLQVGVPMRMRQVYIPVAEQGRTYLFTFADSAEHFDETLAAATSAISSFEVMRNPDASGPVRGRDGAKTALLVLALVIGFALLIGASYLLLQKQRAK